MTIDWANFTWLSALLGGLLISLATLLLTLLNQKVAGVSGILGGLLRRTPGDRSWRMAFLLGLMLAPQLYLLADKLPQIHIEAPWPLLLLAGLLVGFGTRLGNGCTSGHGIYGLARQSPRSRVATLTFMATGMVTVYIVRHVLGGLS